jgi:hypothetical protein
LTLLNISPFGEPLRGGLLMRVNDPHGVGRRDGGRANAGALHGAERQRERDHLFSVLLKEIPEV